VESSEKKKSRENTPNPLKCLKYRLLYGEATATATHSRISAQRCYP